jgi:hypothetical protein
MSSPSKERERKARHSLKKMLDVLEPYLPPKPQSTPPPREDWQPADTSTSENLPIGSKDRECL